MDGEGQANNASQEMEMDHSRQNVQQMGDSPQPMNEPTNEQLDQEEAMLEAQAQSLAEVKRRRKE